MRRCDHGSKRTYSRLPTQECAGDQSRLGSGFPQTATAMEVGTEVSRFLKSCFDGKEVTDEQVGTVSAIRMLQAHSLSIYFLHWNKRFPALRRSCTPLYQHFMPIWYEAVEMATTRSSYQIPHIFTRRRGDSAGQLRRHFLEEPMQRTQLDRQRAHRKRCSR